MISNDVKNQGKSGYVLVVHGSRNPIYRQQLEDLIYMVRECFSTIVNPPPIISAYLELTEKPLHRVILDFAHHCYSQGYKTIKILPLFLISGTHVIHDIPEEVTMAKEKSPLPLHLIPHFGTSHQLIDFLRQQYQPYHPSHKIFFAHGTSLPQGNQELEKMAHKLDASLAYWVTSPSLSDMIHSLNSPHTNTTVILPYFLFTGKITSAIEQTIMTLDREIRDKIIVIPPLGINKDLSKIIANLIS